MDESAYLLLEYLDLGKRGDWASLGRALAALHRVPQSHFGWRRDNYIGDTPQRNGALDDWGTFFVERRLRAQLELAQRNRLADGIGGDLEQLLGRLDALFLHYRPKASLLHGDLWSGNAGFLAGGGPVVFDPAVYCGDREADLAMTELFGGFPERFYAAYREAWPLDPGYERRKHLYNLYHLLNHLNLFGGGYLGQARQTLDLLLRTL